MRGADQQQDLIADSSSRVLWRIIRMLWPYDRADLRLRIGLALAAMLFAKLATTATPLIFKYFIDELNSTTAEVAVFLGLSAITILAIYGLARIISIAFAQLCDALFSSVTQHAVRKLRYAVFRHLHDLSLDYHLSRRTGGVTRDLERASASVDTSLRLLMSNVLPTTLELLLLAPLIFIYFGFEYLLVVFVILVTYVVFTKQYTNYRMSLRNDMNVADSESSIRAVDSLINSETVKSFSNEDWELKQFDAAGAKYEQAAVRSWQSLGVLNTVQNTIFVIGTIVLMAMSTQAVMAGEQTIGDIVMLQTLTLQLARPLFQLGWVYRETRQALLDSTRVLAIIDTVPTVTDAPDATPLVINDARITFQNVSFSYEEDRQILDDISFKVAEGQSLAIVGPSGAGKSTVARLLMRYYDATSGVISIDTTPLTTVPQQNLRQSIGIVPQDTVLFNASLGYNIAYGRPNASPELIAAAVEQAQLKDFVSSLTHGLDTLVGERGLKLSGGEKQRVAIARVIVKNPRILILDEATSALDSETEQHILTTLNAVQKGRTTVIIAHRLSTVVNADHIIVLKGGKIAEYGSHQQLLDADGIYQNMWNRQQELSSALELLKASEQEV